MKYDFNTISVYSVDVDVDKDIHINVLKFQSPKVSENNMSCNDNKSAAGIVRVSIKLEAEKATYVDLNKQIENIMYIFYCGTEGQVDTK